VRLPKRKHPKGQTAAAGAGPAQPGADGAELLDRLAEIGIVEAD